jgi:hypothetical protein
VYRRILGLVYNSENENWITQTNKEIYAIGRKTHYNRENVTTWIMLVWTCTENGRKRVM